MSEGLKLELGKVYVDADKKLVRIIRQYDEFDHDFKQGFRFRGDNNVNYLEDGSIVGEIDGATVFQVGSVPLVSVYEGNTNKLLQIYGGECYRNHAGMTVMIVDVVSETSRYYEQGYRFIDDRNTYYKPDGTAYDSGIWTSLNLARHIPIEEVTDEQLAKIRSSIERNAIREERYEYVVETYNQVKAAATRVAKRWGIPVAVGIGLGFTSAAAMSG